METSVYELVQKRQELVTALAELREQRKEEAVKKVRVGEEENVDSLSLDTYREKAEELMEKIQAVTVALRRKNVAAEIDEVGLTPEEARIRRDMLDKEIRSLRDLRDAEEEGFLRGSSDVVRVSRVEREEIDERVRTLTEERSSLDAALQRFNLEEEIQVAL